MQSLNPTDLFFDRCVREIVNLQWYGTIQWIADAAMLLQGADPIDWARIVARSRPVERWEAQLFVHPPTPARKLAALWLGGQRWGRR